MSSTCTTGSFPGQFDNNTTLDRSNGTQYIFPSTAYDCQVKDGSGTLLGRIAYTPGTPARSSSTASSSSTGSSRSRATRTSCTRAAGTIYATDEIKMQGNLNLCPVAGCNAALWDPDTTILGFVGGASGDSGFLIENYTTFHGSIYIVNDYFQKNNVNVCGPVIAQELFIENGSHELLRAVRRPAAGRAGRADRADVDHADERPEQLLDGLTLRVSRPVPIPAS